MSEADNDYELDVLRMVINEFLDESISLTKSGLNTLETRRDWVVWDVATRIYSQSGCRVELTMVRDIVNSRIRIIKNHLAEEARRLIKQKAQQEAEEVRRLIEQKAQQEAEEVHRLIRQKAQQEAEEVRRLIEQKAQQEVKEARRIIRQKAQQEEEVRRLIEQKAQQEAEEARRAAESNPQFIAKRKSEIFIRVRKVISNTLEVDEKDVTLESHLSIDLGADPVDLWDLLMQLEEEFDIEISDEVSLNALDIVFPDLSYSFPDISDIFNIFNTKPKITSPTVSKSKVAEKAIVRNVVELLWEKAQCF